MKSKKTSAKTKAILVRAATGKYSVVCRRGALEQAQKEIARLGKFSSVQILSSPLVWHALEKKIRQGISARLAPNVHLFDDAESEKNLQSVEGLAQSLVSSEADRHALVVAIGGVVPARNFRGPCADNAGCAGGQRDWGKDWRESSGREEPSGSVLPAAIGAGGSRTAGHVTRAGIPRRAGGSDQVWGDRGRDALCVSGEADGRHLAPRYGRAGACDPALDRDQGASGEQGREGIWLTRDFEFCAYVWTCAGVCDALPAIPAWRSNRMGNDVRGAAGA